MRNSFFLIILSILLSACSFTSEQITIVPEEILSLNGEWKFNTIYGQGYNYLNVTENTSDIIIDNADRRNVEVKGNWKLSTKRVRNSNFYGKNYYSRFFKEGQIVEGESYVRFRPKIKKSGYYEVFVTHPFSSHLTTQCNVNHSNGKTENFVSQRLFPGEWISVGIYQFDKEDDNYLEFTAISEGQVAADAVLFKPISKEKYLEAKKLPNEVFKTDFDDSKWYDLKVPGHWGMINNFSNYTGKGWYRKSFELPQNWSAQDDERIRIQFGAVYHLAKIYINGKFVGKHQGGFTPFEFDITDFVKFGAKNIIAVEANNAFIVGATWNWGGIIRDVTIKKDKDVRIQHQYIHAEPDLEKGSAEVILKVRLENNSESIRTIDVVSKIKEIDDTILSQKGIKIAANSTETIFLKTTLSAENAKLWHFDDPNLYTLQTTISDSNINLDSEEDNFGIRKIELTDSQLVLNGEPIRTGGFNRVSEQRYYGSSEPLEVLEKDVDLMKRSGANFMRIMHGTQNEKLIELCDKKGILLFEEVNVRDLSNPEFTAPEYPLVKSWIKEMIERDINHPSIIGWSVGNELSYHYDYGKKMMEYVKTELDEYRLLTCVSNSGQKPYYTPKNDPNTHVDIIMHNMYRWQGKPQTILNTLREKWPNKPVFISEYGFDPYPTASLDGDKPIVSEWNQNFRGKNEFVVGTSMWTFNDYRSGYAGTSAEENRVWGVVNVWGQERRLFDRFQNENSPIKTFDVAPIDLSKKSTEIKISTKEISDYPSYTLKNYKLVYTFSSESGETLFKDELDLPTLTPGTSWDGKIEWNSIENPYSLVVKVINPLGYERAEKENFFKVPEAPVINQVISGNGKARIYFDKTFGVKEYKVAYKTQNGVYQYSKPTISNFITLDSLSNNLYEVALIALNAKGDSETSKIELIKPNGKSLPPVIWKSFITNTKLVVGYSSDFEDANYTVKYGSSKENLDQEFTSNVRGMMSIDLDDENEVYFKIKRTFLGKESNWSPVVKATITK